MNDITVMSIPCGFKIKKKTDTEMFVNKCMLKGNEYYLKINENYALILRKEKDGTVSILEKSYDLLDIFNPILEVANTSNRAYKCSVYDYIWKYRKYINEKWFND